MSLDKEQEEIIKHIDSILDKYSGYGWGHFQGDVIPRVLAHYISKHLPNNRKIVGPNVYIRDIATEYDLMIVVSDSNPMAFTSAYPYEQVKCVIEVKRRGLFGNEDNFRKAVERIKNNFDKAKRVNCKAAYITICETVNPKRKGSINYGLITRELLAPYPAFILQDSRNKKTQSGEWQRFIECVTSE